LLSETTASCAKSPRELQKFQRTACAHLDEITLVTYSSSGTSLITVSRIALDNAKNAAKTWRSLRSQ